MWQSYEPLIRLGHYEAYGLTAIINYCANKGWVAQEWLWRDPVTNFELNGSAAIEPWHKDGPGTTSVSTRYLILWSSSQPTQIQLPDGTIITPSPFEIVVVDNEVCSHRKQLNIGKQRDFARGTCAQKINWVKNINPLTVRED